MGWDKAYDMRLEKYVSRGYAIGVPGLKEQYVDRNIFEARFLHEKEFDVLVRLDGPVKRLPEKLRTHFTLLKNWSGEMKHEMTMTTERHGRCVKGLERLLVLDEFQSRRRGINLDIIESKV